ncbi:hypothetical protein F5Y04DRAFT_247276 [Hypomontagnella monticulosa]|nr:hypothetical protein F5Y04DRAFT_247276 [Hypomontagnella monticulosa]
MRSGMPRRSHRKSRAGCSECKRRHIKCDENRPACGNCSISSRHCSFLLSQPNLPTAGEERTASPTPNFPPQSGASTPSHCYSPISPNHEFSPIQDVNMTHLELFHHSFTSNFDLPPTSENPEKNMSPSMIVETALSYPFLMSEMLAVAALHLAHLRPEKAQFYKHHAVGLQTHALGIFNREMTKVTRENCVAILLFTWFMTLHTLCETTESPDVPGFLDRFIHYMQLHRGVRAVTGEAWQLMLESKMGFVLQEAARLLDHIGSGTHTTEIKECIQKSETLRDDEKLTCTDGLDRIQWFLSKVDGPEEKDPSLVATFLSLTSWPVIINADFLRLASKRTPEALLVLSYYAIPLHLCRNIWVIGSTGRLLIQSVRLHLDEKWHKWLDWPETLMENMPIRSFTPTS